MRPITPLDYAVGNFKGKREETRYHVTHGPVLCGVLVGEIDEELREILEAPDARAGGRRLPQ